MKTKTNYQQAKTELKECARVAKTFYHNDKPAVNMTINNYADSIIKELNLTNYQQNLLSNYACTLHPKN